MTTKMGRLSSTLSASKGTTLPCGALIACCVGQVTTLGKENLQIAIMATLQEDSMKTSNQHCCFVFVLLRWGEHQQVALSRILFLRLSYGYRSVCGEVFLVCGIDNLKDKEEIDCPVSC